MRLPGTWRAAYRIAHASDMCRSEIDGAGHQTVCNGSDACRGDPVQRLDGFLAGTEKFTDCLVQGDCELRTAGRTGSRRQCDAGGGRIDENDSGVGGHKNSVCARREGNGKHRPADAIPVARLMRGGRRLCRELLTRLTERRGEHPSGADSGEQFVLLSVGPQSDYGEYTEAEGCESRNWSGGPADLDEEGTDVGDGESLAAQTLGQGQREQVASANAAQSASGSSSRARSAVATSATASWVSSGVKSTLAILSLM